MSSRAVWLRYTIQCDSCSTEYKQVGGNPVSRWRNDNRDIINGLLADDGWQVDGDRHVCPDCVPVREMEQR